MQLAFIFPANKHPTSYEDVFRHTVSEAAKLGVNVFPTIVYADFETAIYNGVTTAWPGLEIKACRFHVRQSWCRKMQSLGLSKQERKTEVSQFLKSANALLLEFLSNLPNDKRV